MNQWELDELEQGLRVAAWMSCAADRHWFMLAAETLKARPPRRKTMTREQFERYWATNSGIPVETMHELGLHADPCECGDPTCLGWAVDWEHSSTQPHRTLRTLGGGPGDSSGHTPEI